MSLKIGWEISVAPALDPSHSPPSALLLYYIYLQGKWKLLGVGGGYRWVPVLDWACPCLGH